jgi:hypothetical protein
MNQMPTGPQQPPQPAAQPAAVPPVAPIQPQQPLLQLNPVAPQQQIANQGGQVNQPGVTMTPVPSPQNAIPAQPVQTNNPTQTNIASNATSTAANVNKAPLPYYQEVNDTKSDRAIKDLKLTLKGVPPGALVGAGISAWLGLSGVPALIPVAAGGAFGWYAAKKYDREFPISLDLYKKYYIKQNTDNKQPNPETLSPAQERKAKLWAHANAATMGQIEFQKKVIADSWDIATDGVFSGAGIPDEVYNRWLNKAKRWDRGAAGVVYFPFVYGFKNIEAGFKTAGSLMKYIFGDDPPKPIPWIENWRGKSMDALKADKVLSQAENIANKVLKGLEDLLNIKAPEKAAA